MVEYLLENGAKVNVQDDGNYGFQETSEESI